MRIYYAIRNYSKIYLQKKPFRQKILFNIYKSVSTIHNNTITENLCISKLLDDFKIQYNNKFTCLLSKCIFCNSMALFINKVTGKYFLIKYFVTNIINILYSNVLGWFICTHCLRYGTWSTYKSYMHKNKEIVVPTPKLFEAGKSFKDFADSLIHFKSLKTNSKRSILKSLNLEVIIFQF